MSMRPSPHRLSWLWRAARSREPRIGQVILILFPSAAHLGAPYMAVSSARLSLLHIPACKPFGTRLKTEPRGSALCWKSESLGCCYDGRRVSRARYSKTQAGFTCGDILGAEIIGQNIENVLHLNLRKIYHKTKFWQKRRETCANLPLKRF